MSQYKSGDIVKIIGIGKVWGNDFNQGISAIPNDAQAMVGKMCEIEEVFDDGDISIYTPDKSDTWTFHESELENETIIKPKKQQMKNKEEKEETQDTTSHVETEPVEQESGDTEEDNPYGGQDVEGEVEGDDEDQDQDSDGGGGGQSNYIVVGNADVDALIKEVNKHLQSGLVVVGSVVIARNLKEKRNWFYQTLIRTN